MPQMDPNWLDKLLKQRQQERSITMTSSNSTSDIKCLKLAESLFQAYQTQTSITLEAGDLTLDQAYQVQQLTF